MFVVKKSRKGRSPRRRIYIFFSFVYVHDSVATVGTYIIVTTIAVGGSWFVYIYTI